eukprot:scaffold15.g4239.t1
MATEGLSYSAQYDQIFANKLSEVDSRARLPKPDPAAQSHASGAHLVPFSDVAVTPKLPDFIGRRDGWTFFDAGAAVVIFGLHLLCLAAPFTFTWPAFWTALALYFAVGCLGIDVSFHRQLTHRSFCCPKWLEYTLAYLGTMGLEHDPIVWHHRFHHYNTDTALDPHSSYEGFWWSHAGWLLHHRMLNARTGSDWIVTDLVADPFYRFLHATYYVQAGWQFLALYLAGGLPFVVWAGAVRQVAMWHVTWLVNSACHLWGARPYRTGDLSTNNSWLTLLTFGESWHNNHHAFPFSARHGIEWWQVDIAWGCIRALQAVGLAHDIRLPSEGQKRRLAVVGGVASCEDDAGADSDGSKTE